MFLYYTSMLHGVHVQTKAATN